MFSPYIEAGEIANLPAFSFFMRMAAIRAQEPLSGMTIVPEDIDNNTIAQKVIVSSRENFAIVYSNLSDRVDNDSAVLTQAKPKSQALPGE